MITLEQAKRLKEAGYQQDNAKYVWANNGIDWRYNKNNELYGFVATVNAHVKMS